jgi:hypothetical protein
VRYRDVVRCAVLASCLTMLAPAAQAQRLATTELFARGKAAYDRLPATVTLADARDFSEALTYLYAYEQRTLRERGHVEGPTQRAIDWLVESIGVMKTGKSDGSNRRDDEELLARGLTMLDSAERSDEGGRLWHVAAFLSGSANLFAYLQSAPSPSQRARKGYEWLSEARGRLVVAGTKSDGPELSTWVPPSRPRPGAPSMRSMADRARSTSTMSGATRAIATPPAGGAGERGADRRVVVDSLRELRESNERLRRELDAANTANDSLRRANEQLQRMLDAGARDVATAAQLIGDGRLREARDLARGWLAANPSDGDAHMVLARVYAGASRANATPEDRAVAWLAVHHLTIAIKSGAIGYDVGLKMLTELEARTPTADDLALRGWVIGQPLRVNFAPYEWIDEVTTIRARREVTD